MTEVDAWQTLEFYAHKAGAKLTRSMSVQVLRRTLAKHYQPRTTTDDDSIMRKINPAIDLIATERDRRELAGEPEPEDPAAQESKKPTTKHTGVPPWQPNPGEPSRIFRQDFTDLNFIRKTVYERAVRFGDVELAKAWAWDGKQFRRVIAAYANEFSFDLLARALLIYESDPERPNSCDAVFLTTGDDVQSFRLILIRIGRGYEDVTRYELGFECYANDPALVEFIPAFLEMVVVRLRKDKTPL